MPRIRQIFTFLGIFALILALSHYYMFERISFYLQLNSDFKLLLALALGAFAVLTLIALPLSRTLPRPVANVMAWFVYPWMGISLLLFTTLLATDIVWISLNLVPMKDLPEPIYLFQHSFGVVALSVAGLLASFSLWKGLREVTIKNLDVTLTRLPKSLNGFRIVQVTDLHIGPLINGHWLRHVVDQINGLKPDLIVITGDLVDGSVEELARHVAPLVDLKSKHGVYFITGNHEYYSGVEQWCAHLKGLGIHVLRNERVSIPSDTANASFDLAGIDDWGSRHFPGGGPNLPKALAGRNASKPLILLAHQPTAVEEAATFGVDLQLSGHTHGGQIWPFTYLVYLQQPYAEGLYRHKDTNTQIYVSPGTGFWGPPMRLGTTAEITHITLRSAL